MHLITALASGINGAASGVATITKRGTSTPATWYSTFEGSGTSTDTVSLDSNGGAVAYVNELVTVTVKDSSGATVRAFTAGDAAPAVEVQSTSFTGTNYEDASSAAGEPTTLQAVLDAWLTSAGSVDFKVLIDGTSTTLENFAGATAGLFFNVKSPEYGAVGDGTTDDSSAVQAAINAAETANGGVVYFPRGTYYLDGDLDFADNVTLRGASREISILELNTYELDVSGAAGKTLKLEDLTFHNTTHGSGELIRISGSQNLKATNCTFGHATTGAFDVVVRADDGDVTLQDCSFFTYDHVIDTRTGAAGGTYRVFDCYFNAINPTNSGTDYRLITLDGSVDLELANTISDASSATFAVSFGRVSLVHTETGYTGNIFAQNNKLFDEPSGTSAYHSVIHSEATSMGDFTLNGMRYESLSAPEDGWARFEFAAVPASGSIVGLPHHSVASNVANLNFGFGYGNTVVTRSDGTALAIALDDVGSIPGDIRTVAVKNTSGGTSVSFYAAVDEVATPVAVGANETYVFRFIRVPNEGSIRWAEIGTAAAAT